MSDVNKSKSEPEAPENAETPDHAEAAGAEAGEPEQALDGESDAAADAGDEPLDLKDALQTYEELMQENSELKDRLLRALSDAENTRRRAARETKDAARFGISNFARDLMDVADNLRRALAALPEDQREAAGPEVQNLIAGIEMTDKELHAAFERHSIKRLHPENEKFDPNFHQAIAEIPGTDKPHGTVVDVVQTGYLIDDRLLRPAMVTVAKGEHPAKQVEPEAAVPENGEGERE